MIKNVIKYYYNLSITDVRKTDGKYIFNVNDIEFEFFPFYENTNYLYNTYVFALRSGRYVHEILYNKSNSIITFYNQIPYILIKKNNNSSKIIDLNYIILYDSRLYGQINLNWKKLWEEKLDYYEYQIKEFGNKYSIVKESFNYYIGLSELAINILNYVDYEKITGCLSHKRITLYETESSFSNPVNLLIDTKVRDIAEYIKINVISDKKSSDEFLKIINTIQLNRTESLLLLARLLYPTYFFDMYDKILQGKLTEDKLNTIIEKNAYFETFLRKVYKILQFKYNLPEIEWLIN